MPDITYLNVEMGAELFQLNYNEVRKDEKELTAPS
jgi:hypothetical protein